ncbi:MAG: MBL fold metallo-hydrolase [Verrucomicrobiota bacterium]
MKVIFWGTQGSLPATVNAQTVREKVFLALQAAQGVSLNSETDINTFIDEELPFAIHGTYGTNTACVQLEADGDEKLILDAGSGLRDLGRRIVDEGKAKVPTTYHIVMTHLHWDHIQGFPFFVPAYIAGNRVVIHTYHEETEAAFRQQMSGKLFPIAFESLAADISFELRKPETPFSLAGYQITGRAQNHPGVSYGYRFEKDGKAVVYSTDSEHKHEAYEEGYPFIAFFQEADLLIFDAQYTMADATFTKANWGHSSNVMGVELAARSHVKQLAIFHHEPTSTDQELEAFLFNTRMYRNIYHQESGKKLGHERYPESIILAYDGLELDV